MCKETSQLSEVLPVLVRNLAQLCAVACDGSQEHSKDEKCHSCSHNGKENLQVCLRICFGDTKAEAAEHPIERCGVLVSERSLMRTGPCDPSVSHIGSADIVPGTSHAMLYEPEHLIKQLKTERSVRRLNPTPSGAMVVVQLVGVVLAVVVVSVATGGGG